MKPISLPHRLEVERRQAKHLLNNIIRESCKSSTDLALFEIAETHGWKSLCKVHPLLGIKLIAEAYADIKKEWEAMP